MAECECLQKCLFFNDKMDDSKGIGKIYKDKYCLGDNSNCARYQVFLRLGADAVPANLYPNMNERAQEIIAAG